MLCLRFPSAIASHAHSAITQSGIISCTDAPSTVTEYDLMYVIQIQNWFPGRETLGEILSADITLYWEGIVQFNSYDITTSAHGREGPKTLVEAQQVRVTSRHPKQMSCSKFNAPAYSHSIAKGKEEGVTDEQ
jgi:hypothetical protein